MLPMTLGISFLSKPIWNVFYGTSEYGPSILSIYIFVGLIIGLFTAMITVVQLFKDYKMVFISLISGVLVKCLLNVSLIRTFYVLGIPAYYGVIVASLLGYLTSFVICIVVLRMKYKIEFDEWLTHFIDILCGSFLMYIVLFIMSLIVPLDLDNRILNIFIIMLYSIVGAVTYFIFIIKTKTLEKIFGERIDKFLKKLVK